MLIFESSTACDIKVKTISGQEHVHTHAYSEACDDINPILNEIAQE